MASKKNLISSPLDTYFKFIVVFLLFLLLAFDKDLATIYLLMMFGDWIWAQTDKLIHYPVSRTEAGSMSTVQLYIESLIGLGVFLFTSVILVSAFDPQSIYQGGVLGGAQSIFHLLSTSTPILQGSQVLTFVGWGILIPIIETSFFNGRLLEGLAVHAEPVFGQKIDVYKFALPMIIVMLVVASLFALFHITAKGLQSIPLLITFLFSFISSAIVIRHRQLRGAIFIHIVVNCMAVLSLWGVF